MTYSSENTVCVKYLNTFSYVKPKLEFFIYVH